MKQISFKEAIKILNWCSNELEISSLAKYSSAACREQRLAGMIEGILFSMGWFEFCELFEYKMIEVENPSVATIFLLKRWVKQTILRKENYVEYMQRQALAYISSIKDQA